jgi:hypothetical protein
MAIVEILATMDGESSQTSGAAMAYAASLTAAGESETTFSGSLQAALGLFPVGGSSMVISPSGITINNFSAGPQIPVTAKPITVPIVRIVPPSPPAPSYSVGSPSGIRNRRREER